MLTDNKGKEHDQLLNAAEVAIKLNVRQKRVYELDIPSVRYSVRTYRWLASDVKKWIERRRAG